MVVARILAHGKKSVWFTGSRSSFGNVLRVLQGFVLGFLLWLGFRAMANRESGQTGRIPVKEQKWSRRSYVFAIIAFNIVCVTFAGTSTSWRFAGAGLAMMTFFFGCAVDAMGKHKRLPVFPGNWDVALASLCLFAMLSYVVPLAAQSMADLLHAFFPGWLA